MSKTIVTHNSTFHADDVFAVATILLMEPDAKIIRTRDRELISKGDFVVDVGYEYDAERNRFDHHQPGGAGKRENGIQYASFGLVWRKFGEKLSGGKEEFELIDQSLVEPLDAHDNGQPIAENIYENLREYTLIDFLYSYLPKDEEAEKLLDETFVKVVGVAKELIVREIGRAKEDVKSGHEVEGIYNETEDKRIIVMDHEYNWFRVLMKLPEPIFVVYPRNDGVSWGIRGVPDSNKVYGTRRKDFPKEWGGKTGEELQKITGVADAIFAHRGLFMASAKTKEGAIEMAKKALNAS